jgi:glycine betaine/proline transport system ATP-binding protein
VFITHDLNEAMFLGDRIAVMRAGEIVQIGTPEEILTSPANDYVEQFVQDVDRSRVLTASAVMQPALAVVPLSVGVNGVAKIMRDLQVSSVFVVERNKLVGGVTEAQIGRARRRGDVQLSEIVDREIPRVKPDDLLTDLFEASVDTSMPLPVVDERERILGVVPRVALLSSMTTNTGAFDLPAGAALTDPQIPVVPEGTTVEEAVEAITADEAPAADLGEEGTR